MKSNQAMYSTGFTGISYQSDATTIDTPSDNWILSLWFNHEQRVSDSEKIPKPKVSSQCQCESCCSSVFNTMNPGKCPCSDETLQPNKQSPPCWKIPYLSFFPMGYLVPWQTFLSDICPKHIYSDCGRCWRLPGRFSRVTWTERW